MRGNLAQDVFDIVEKVEAILTVTHRLASSLSGSTSLAMAASLIDAKDHLGRLVPSGFVTATGRRRLVDLLRYVRAVERRLEKLPANPQRDRTQMATIERVEAAYRDALAGLPPGRGPTPSQSAIRWMIEELRVSVFAQELGTAQPVSEKRIIRALADAVA